MGQSHEPVLVQVELAEVDARAELRADLVEEIVVELQLLQCRPEPHARGQHLEHVVVQVQHLYIQLIHHFTFFVVVVVQVTYTHLMNVY
jgi:hypothetical protein